MSHLSNVSASALADPVQALRQATQSRHQWLDCQLPVARPAATLADYLGHVRMLRGWLAGLAPLLAGTPWGRGCLQAACADLGEPPPAEPRAQAAGAPGHVLGLAYVVEGSQLGGRVLLARLRAAGVQHPMHYLQGRGEATGAHWARCLQALRAGLATPTAQQEAGRAACWAFDDLIARMQAVGSLPAAALEEGA